MSVEAIGQTPQASASRFLVALASALCLVAIAPFVGVIRSELQQRLHDRFTVLLNVLIGLVLVTTLALCQRKVREHRSRRYSMLLAAALLAAFYLGWVSNSDPAIRAVETFHFIEYGLITYLFVRAWRHTGDGSAVVLPILAAFVFGVAEEAYQWFLPARVGELKDVWLNGAAILAGAIGSAAIELPTTWWRWTTTATRSVSRLLAAAVVALAAFLHLVHLGTEVSTGSLVFASRYSADTLTALDAARKEEWRMNPPLTRPDRLSREDQFMTEGLQHVQARNRAWTEGDALTAWHENAILERSFGAVLDTPSYVAAQGHRWPSDQRQDAALRAGSGVGQPFTSQAFPYPIYFWPPLGLWTVALLASALVWRIGATSE